MLTIIIDMNPMNHKKSQMEILGLAVVVVLVLVGVMLMLTLGQSKKDDVQKRFTDVQLATNFLNTLLDTTSGCRGTDVADLIVDCVEHTGDEAQIIHCGDKDSCAFSQEIIRNMTNATMNQWNQKYVFSVVAGGSPQPLSDFSFSNPPGRNACAGEQEKEEFFYPSSQGQVKIALAICR